MGKLRWRDMSWADALERDGGGCGVLVRELAFGLAVVGTWGRVGASRLLADATCGPISWDETGP